jgi:uncharacterized protein DUF6064
MLPFSREQFESVFGDYNVAVWPVQWLACLLGAAIMLMLLRPSRGRDRGVGAGLAVMWAWTGFAYHGLFFSTINKAALVFGVLFVVQGAMLFHAGVLRGQLRFGRVPRGRAWLGWSLLIYASVGYPVVGLWTGHRYPEMPMFGITPCPVTLFTVGCLLLASVPVPRRLVAIPFVWSLIGGSAAFLLDMPQDWPLLLSALAILAAAIEQQAGWGRLISRKLPSP